MRILKLTRRFFDSTETPAPAGGGGGDSETPKTFTQDEVNKFLADERRKQAKQLDDLKKSSGLTAAEKANLENQIKSLQTQFQTKEEQLVEQHTAKLNDLTTKAADLEKREAFWRENFATATFQARTVAAATQKEAFNPALVADLLKPKMELVEIAGADGRPSGKFEPRVRLTKKDGEKLVDVLLAPEEAVEAMVKDTAQFGMLFKGTKNSGLGGGNTPGTSTDSAELVKSNPAAYRDQYRKAQYGDKK